MLAPGQNLSDEIGSFWEQLIERVERDGASERHEAFAERQGVRCDSFRGWLYRIRGEKRGRTARGKARHPALAMSSMRCTDRVWLS